MVKGFGLETVKGDYRIQISQIRDLDDRGRGWLKRMRHFDWVQMEDFSEAFSVARKRWPETTAHEADTFYFLPCWRGFLRWLRLCVPLTPHRRKGAPCGSLLPAVLHFWDTTLNG
jgi:hypothetical protein